MSKKSLPGQLTGDSAWRESEDVELPRQEAGALSRYRSARARGDKPPRQRIEEYFERKRLAEALQEDLREDFFADEGTA